MQCSVLVDGHMSIQRLQCMQTVIVERDLILCRGNSEDFPGTYRQQQALLCL